MSPEKSTDPRARRMSSKPWRDAPARSSRRRTRRLTLVPASNPLGSTSPESGYHCRSSRRPSRSREITLSTAASMSGPETDSSMTVNSGSSPSSSAWARRMREHMPWMVDIQASSTCSATSPIPSSMRAPRTRSRISAAASLVNVMASTWSRPWMKGPDSGESAQRILRVRVKVLPEPAPAETKSGRSRVVTMSRCCGMRVERSIVMRSSARIQGRG